MIFITELEIGVLFVWLVAASLAVKGVQLHRRGKRKRKVKL